MTRLAVFSDIHANIPALEAVEADCQQFNVDQVIVAGDVITFGPFPQQVVKRVVESGWSVIRGNGELFLLDYGTPRAPREWDDPTAFPIPRWLNRQIESRWKTAVAAWPETMRLEFPDAPPIRVVHGTPGSPWESLYPTLTDAEIESYLEGVQEETVIAGHTHLGMDRQCGYWHLLNPGSVGTPLDGQPTASYLILQGDERGWRPLFRRVPFPYEPIFQEFERIGFVEACGVIGQLFVDVFKSPHPQAGFFRWKEIHYPGAQISWELYREYSENCQWWDYCDPVYLNYRQ
jgi:predicted phosphodiesterase